ncbi:MAG: FAD binding domain-containing protein [Zhaonellaceae bacterium]|nr:xanthine dehydrogenase family protein subunit M [Clostridia bacterium]
MGVEFYKPQKLEDVLDVLATKKGPLKILAGGTDLMLDIRNKKYEVAGIVDINLLSELKNISVEGEFIKIGSLVTFTQLANSTLLQERVPFLVEAANSVGAPQIRNQGTIGGNIANASPAADSVVPLIALDAICSVLSPLGNRDIPLNQLLCGVGKTRLASDELIVEVKFKLPRKITRSAFVKFGRRNALAIARMSVAILLGLDGNKVNAARVALGAVAPNPFRSLELENMFLNKAMEEIDVDEVIARSSMVVSQALGNRPSAKWKNEAIKGLMRQVLSKIGIM